MCPYLGRRGSLLTAVFTPVHRRYIIIIYIIIYRTSVAGEVFFTAVFAPVRRSYTIFI